MKVYTIGFTQKNARTFFNLLRENNVKKVIDIRLNNTSQLAAFAKGEDLKFFLTEFCKIDYIHDTAFAPTEVLLKGYKNKEVSWLDYEKEFSRIMERRNIKEYILEFQFTYHRTPTMAQIAEAVGTVKSNVYKYLAEMEERGILTRRKREIVINDTIQASPELNRVPILGNVSCGLPEYAEENFEEYVPLPVALFGQGDFYLLRASGNSMIEAGIDPGDLVVVRKQNTAEEGDIVVALVDNETTLCYRSQLSK